MTKYCRILVGIKGNILIDMIYSKLIFINIEQKLLIKRNIVWPTLPMQFKKLLRVFSTKLFEMKFILLHPFYTRNVFITSWTNFLAVQWRWLLHNADIHESQARMTSLHWSYSSVKSWSCEVSAFFPKLFVQSSNAASWCALRSKIWFKVDLPVHVVGLGWTSHFWEVNESSFGVRSTFELAVTGSCIAVSIIRSSIRWLRRCIENVILSDFQCCTSKIKTPCSSSVVKNLHQPLNQRMSRKTSPQNCTDFRFTVNQIN